MTEHMYSYPFALESAGKHWLDLTDDAVLWNISDTGWAKSAWSSLYAPWLRGSCVFTQHSSKFDAIQILKVSFSSK